MITAATASADVPVFSTTCPRCGAEVAVKQIPTDHGDLQIYGPQGANLDAIKNMIQQAASSGATADEVADLIEARAPAYKQFGDWLRANPWFMALGAAVIGPILTVLLTHWINAPSPPTHDHITRIIEEHTATVTESPPPPSSPNH